MFENPAYAAFAAALPADSIFGQVRIRREAAGFTLRHRADTEAPEEKLTLLADEALRAMTQFDARHRFRPLKSSPDLCQGWRAVAPHAQALGAALDLLYPGAVADWFACRNQPPPVTDYRAFTGRQTGMYRITTFLDDPTAAAIARACCHKDFCLKRRLWTVGALPADAAEEKSLIPCLEPCAVLLEFARKIARLEQEAQTRPAPDPAEIVRQRADAEKSLADPNSSADVAVTDFDSLHNPRRRRFLLEKYRPDGTVNPGQ